jgi:hypothetical protein
MSGFAVVTSLNRYIVFCSRQDPGDIQTAEVQAFEFCSGLLLFGCDSFKRLVNEFASEFGGVWRAGD